MAIDKIELTRELNILHRQYFRRDAPHTLIENYIRAHMESPDIACSTDGERRTMRIIIEKKLDALGIEPWLRSGPKRHLLTRKLLLISYLAECDASHPEFRQEVKGHVRSFYMLCSSSVLACLHLIRGKYQKAFYGLI